MLTKSATALAVLLNVFLLPACGENKQTIVSPVLQVKSASAEPSTNENKSSANEPTVQSKDGPAIATITAPEYQANIHQAISFLPKDEGIDMMKVKPGHRFIVLDMSVKNISKTKELDMGQILLSSKVTDDKGKEYSLSAMAIAAYTLQNPDPHHHAQYNAIWGKIKPGEFYRTTALGLEVPTGTKNLTLSLKEDGDTFKESRRFQAKFTVE